MEGSVILKTVTVLLTKYSDFISSVVYHIGGRGYTHSSISLEGDDNYYSFNYHGFCIETMDKHKQRGVENSIAFELLISDEHYNKIKSRITEIQLNCKEYSYTRIGLVFAILKIPFQWRKHYFCSQFIAELLKEYGGIPLKKESYQYLPNHFRHELNSFCFLNRIIYNPI